MSGRPSTIRTSGQHTIDDPLPADQSREEAARIVKFWREQADASVLRTCEAFPDLPNNRSLLLDLAVEEFKLRNGDNGNASSDYCAKFREFGSSLENSIFRAIEVQNYLDGHPELLELVVDFEWPTPGDSLQGFVVVDELGRGAIARVYLCRESVLGGREVVVKVARGGGYEAKLLARLDHPNIIPIYSVVNDQDRFVSYICMPFRGRNTFQQLVDSVVREFPKNWRCLVAAATEGSNADARAKSGAPRSGFCGTYVDGVIRLAIKLTDALSHAHAAGVLHGDLKPSNVILTTTGEPLLIDFNLARDQWSDSTPCGGTLAYMPPETLRGLCQGDTSAKYDVRSEIYSFGAVLYQLLTGEVPFPVQLRADAAAAALALLEKQSGEVPGVCKSNPSVNKGLERLILDCLSIDPSDRPATMDYVCIRLQKQDAAIVRLARGMRSRPRLTVATAVMLAATIAVSAWAFWNRPPFTVRQLNHGVELAGSGEHEAAIGAFSDAAKDPSVRSSALHHRAIAYLKSGETDRASEDFYCLSREYGDRSSMAFVGYCFNLRKVHAAAIMWYEKALTEGLESAALQSNLGVSYAICQSHVGHLERFDLAEQHLKRALELDRESIPARINILVVAVVRGRHIEKRSASDIANAAEYLLRARPDDQVVLRLAGHAYGWLSTIDGQYLNRCAEVVKLSLEGNAGPTQSDLRGSPAYKSLRELSTYPSLIALAQEKLPKSLNVRVPQFRPPLDLETLSLETASVSQHSLK